MSPVDLDSIPASEVRVGDRLSLRAFGEIVTVAEVYRSRLRDGANGWYKMHFAETDVAVELREDDRVDRVHRAAAWPAAATATPPAFPFKNDRHNYADNAEWRKQNGLSS